MASGRVEKSFEGLRKRVGCANGGLKCEVRGNEKWNEVFGSSANCRGSGGKEKAKLQNCTKTYSKKSLIFRSFSGLFFSLSGTSSSCTAEVAHPAAAVDKQHGQWQN